METATQAAGVQLVVLEASTENDLEAAFAFAVQQRAGAILVSAYPFFTSSALNSSRSRPATQCRQPTRGANMSRPAA